MGLPSPLAAPTSTRTSSSPATVQRPSTARLRVIGLPPSPLQFSLDGLRLLVLPNGACACGKNVTAVVRVTGGSLMRSLALVRRGERVVPEIEDDHVFVREARRLLGRTQRLGTHDPVAVAPFAGSSSLAGRRYCAGKSATWIASKPAGHPFTTGSPGTDGIAAAAPAANARAAARAARPPPNISHSFMVFSSSSWGAAQRRYGRGESEETSERLDFADERAGEC